MFLVKHVPKLKTKDREENRLCPVFSFFIFPVLIWQIYSGETGFNIKIKPIYSDSLDLGAFLAYNKISYEARNLHDISCQWTFQKEIEKTINKLNI